MEKTKATSIAYAFGEDAASIEANRAYQDALKKLSESLDQRKNRFFEPTLLAAAQGFLQPGTSNFFDSLGNVAGNIAKSQEAQVAEDQAIALQRFNVAGQGVELQRMKARDKEISDYINGRRSPAAPRASVIAGPQAGPSVGPLSTSLSAVPGEPIAGQGALPTVLPSAEPRVVGSPQGALSAMEANKPPGFEGVQGVQVIPPNLDFISGRDYVRLNRNDVKKSFADLLKDAQEIDRKRFQVTEGGVVDLASGMSYQYPTGKTEEIQIYGYPGTHKVDARDAARLSLLAANNDPAYHDLAARVIKGPRKRDAGEAKPGQDDQGGIKSTQQLEIEQKEAVMRAGKLGEEAAKKEAAVGDTASTARRVFGNATRVAELVNQSPTYFGIFARPGVISAIGNLVREGIQTPSGSLNIAGFENSMRQMMPKVTQKDLDNVTKAATELAELELAFTRLYLAQQGAVTEGERKIVRAIPGTTSSSPEVLRTRMELLKSRSQYDLDVVDAFRQWQDDVKNPGRSYLEFERKSDLYKDIKKNFEEETERIFGGIKAVPTRQRVAEAAAKPAPGSGKDLSSARKRVDAVLKD